MFKALIYSLLLIATVLAYEPYRNHKLFDIQISTQEQYNSLHLLESQGKIDVWTEAPVDGKFTVRVAPENIADFISFVMTKQVKLELVNKDLQEMVDKEKMDLEKVQKYIPGEKSLEDDFFKNFRNLDEIKNWIQDKVQRFPNLVSFESIGNSYEKKPIWVMTVEGQRGTQKPVVVFNGAIHAREWISPVTILYIANELITKYDTDPKIKKIVDSISWRIIPVSNPDGYGYTWNRDRMWRKTRSPNHGSSCVGTDGNRNWAYKWATSGSSSSPCSEIFHGSKPFSEVETRTIAEYMNKTQNIKIFVDYHSYGNMFMRPWGYSGKDIPKHENEMKKLNDDCAAAIKSVYGVSFRTGRIAVTIYPASGNTADWGYGAHQIFSYAVELRGGGFVVPPSEIEKSGKEQFAAVLVMANHVLGQ